MFCHPSEILFGGYTGDELSGTGLAVIINVAILRHSKYKVRFSDAPGKDRGVASLASLPP